MSQALFILWVALIGADRIDLAGGAAPFVLTPFLALTPIVVAAELVRHFIQRRRITLSKPAVGYLTLCAALLCVVFGSVLASAEPSVSAARAALLAAQIGGTLAVATLAADRDDFGQLLARGASYGIALFLVFDAGGLAAWLGWLHNVVHLGWATVNLESFAYAGVIPRLSGPVADPNRAGWLLIVMTFFALAGERRPGIQRASVGVAALLMVGTLSRSTLFGALAMLLVIATNQRPLRIPLRPLAGLSFLLVLIVPALLFVQVPSQAVQRVAPLAERFSVAEGSAQSHFALLGRGMSEATQSVPRVLIGMGYGSSYLTLQDVFPDSRYGNFHSMYVTMFAECGVVALLLMLLLVAGPLVIRGPYRALIAGAAVFSVFYQATAEPALWLALALAWASMRVRAVREPTVDVNSG